MNPDAEFHKRLNTARTEAGLTQADVVYELRQLMPKPMWIGQSTLHRLETKTSEQKADPFLINVLATIYRRNTSDLSQVAADSLQTLRDLLEHASPCITAGAADHPQLEFAH